MARKLWNLVAERKAAGEPIHTLGAIDPVQMTQQAPHQEVLYLSGWACSSVLTSTNEVSPTLATTPTTRSPTKFSAWPRPNPCTTASNGICARP